MNNFIQSSSFTGQGSESKHRKRPGYGHSKHFQHHKATRQDAQVSHQRAQPAGPATRVVRSQVGTDYPLQSASCTGNNEPGRERPESFHR